MNRRAYSTLFLLPLLSGCVTGMYHDRQVNRPGYYQGTATTIIRPKLWQASSSADNALEAASPSAPQVGTDRAALGLLASAFTLANNPDYYKKSTIGGRCVLDSSLDGVEIPCVNITIALTDSAHHELERTQSSIGDFEFYVEKGKEYGLRIVSDRYEMTTAGWLGPLMIGDDVVLRIAPKSHASLGR
jgi:hypothetical protein